MVNIFSSTVGVITRTSACRRLYVYYAFLAQDAQDREMDSSKFSSAIGWDVD